MNLDNTFPHGLVLELDKFLRLPHNRLEEYKNLIKNYKEKYGIEISRSTAFGDFDLIGVQAINSFPEYRQNSSRSYTWLGNQQSILLTPISEDKYRKFSFCRNVKKHGLNIAVDGNEIATPFFGVTLLYVSSRTRARLKTYNKFLEYCQNAIEGIVDKFNEKTNAGIVCEVYSTFHFAEIAILWAAEQFVDIISLVEKIRDLNFYFDTNDSLRVFNSSYSIISLLRNNITDDQKKNFKGEALIQCSIKETGGDRRKKDKEIADFVNKNIQKQNTANSHSKAVEEVKFCAGGLDLIFSVDIATLYKIFASKDAEERTFYYYNSEFQQNVEKTVTRLYYKENDLALQFNEIPWDELTEVKISNEDVDTGIQEFELDAIFSCGDIQKNGIDDLFNSIRTKLVSLSPLMSGILSTFDLLYSDYIQCIAGANDDFWLNDFQTQFSSLLSIVNSATESFLSNKSYAKTDPDAHAKMDQESYAKMDPDSYLKLLQELFEIINAQMSHITDAGRPYLDVTRSHFSGMEQVDLTLHAYYGIVKDVLQNIYSNAGINQSPLVPVISLVPMSQVASVLYYDEQTAKDAETRLINIELPYDVWSFFHYHIPLIIHELYHYAAPLSRGLRNFTVGILSIYQIVCYAVELMAKEVWKKEKASTRKYNEKDLEQFRSALRKQIWNYVMSKSEDLANAIPGMQYSDSSACLMYQFRANLNQWIYGEGEFSDSCLTMASFWKEFRLFLVSKKQDIISVTDDKDKTQSLLSGLIDELSIISDASSEYEHYIPSQNVQELEYLYKYDDILDEAVEQTREYYNVQIGELVPDLAMVTLLDMSPEEYLAQFAVFQDNSLIRPADAEYWKDLVVRLGIVLDWLLIKMEPTDSDELFKKFLDLKDPFAKLYDNACGGDSSRVANGIHADADEWFGTFTSFFRTYINAYSIEREWMHCYIEKQIMPLFENKKCTRIRDIMREYNSILRDNSVNSKSDVHFTHVIQSIRLLQKQPLLHEINEEFGSIQAEASRRKEKCDDAIEQLNIIRSKYSALEPFSVSATRMVIDFDSAKNTDWQNKPIRLTVDDDKRFYRQLARLTQCMKEAHKEKFNQELSGQKIWYRGVKDKNYHLLPSILVNYLKCVDISNDKNYDPEKWKYPTVHALQRDKYERFKYRADGAPEVFREYRYTKIDYLALMQHYSQLTTLMDWSEDAFASMYFALEPYFKNDPNASSTDAALYLFDPEMYNTARLEIMKEVGTDEEVLRRIKKSTLIPNISIGYNGDIFKEFTCSEDISPQSKTYLDYSADPEIAVLGDAINRITFQLPLAVYTSQISRRIRAQSGIFVAYSPETLPLLNRNKMPELATKPSTAFNYIALDRLQKYYLNSPRKYPNAFPFLRQLVISASCAKKLVASLKDLGINRYRIYPELEELE